MKNTATFCALTTLFAIDVLAVRLGETQIVKIIPDQYDALMGLD